MTEATEGAAAAETAAPVKAPKPEPIIQNGIRAPKAGGLCDQAWSACLALSQELGRTPAMSEAVARGKELGLNEGNVRVEYSRWRKFHGITERVPDPAKAEKLAAKEAEKAAKAAEKEAKAVAAQQAKEAKAAEKAAKAEQAAADKAAKAEAKAAEKAAAAEAAAAAKAAAAAAETAPDAPVA